jgi:hypothetical protein
LSAVQRGLWDKHSSLYGNAGDGLRVPHDRRRVIGIHARQYWEIAGVVNLDPEQPRGLLVGRHVMRIAYSGSLSGSGERSASAAQRRPTAAARRRIVGDVTEPEGPVRFRQHQGHLIMDQRDRGIGWHSDDATGPDDPTRRGWYLSQAGQCSPAGRVEGRCRQFNAYDADTMMSCNSRSARESGVGGSTRRHKRPGDQLLRQTKSCAGLPKSYL